MLARQRFSAAWAGLKIRHRTPAKGRQTPVPASWSDVKYGRAARRAQECRARAAQEDRNNRPARRVAEYWAMTETRGSTPPQKWSSIQAGLPFPPSGGPGHFRPIPKESGTRGVLNLA